MYILSIPNTTNSNPARDASSPPTHSIPIQFILFITSLLYARRACRAFFMSQNSPRWNLKQYQSKWIRWHKPRTAPCPLPSPDSQLHNPSLCYCFYLEDPSFYPLCPKLNYSFNIQHLHKNMSRLFRVTLLSSCLNCTMHLAIIAQFKLSECPDNCQFINL